jgi:phosphotransferase system  glucose/maltose/N-acetylglucosamine-specific IIC component
MKRLPVHYLIMSVLFLAFIGLIYELVNNPGSFFLKIFIVAGIALGLYFIFRFIQNRKNPLNRKYQQAVKKSQNRYKQQKLRPNRKKTHLTVIDGKKNKKRNGTF